MLRSALFWPLLVLSTAVLGLLSIATGPFDRHGRAIQRYSRLWGRIGVRLAGARIAVSTDGPLPRGVVYVANHQSAVDVFVLAAVLPGQVRWVAKRELFRIPVLGRAMRAAGYVEVDRDDPVRSRGGLSRAGALLAAGTSLVVFPEGTRSADGRLQRFKRGAFALAQAAGAPVVPVAIRGSRDVLPPVGWRVHPGPVSIAIAPPIAPEGLSQAELAERAHAAVTARLGLTAPAGRGAKAGGRAPAPAGAP